jgi:hypothetical protein
VKEVVVLKIKVWQAIVIALAASVEFGMGLGWVLHLNGF